MQNSFTPTLKYIRYQNLSPSKVVTLLYKARYLYKVARGRGPSFYKVLEECNASTFFLAHGFTKKKIDYFPSLPEYNIKFKFLKKIIFQTRTSLLKVDGVGNVVEEAPAKLANSILLFCKGLGWLTSVNLPGVERRCSTISNDGSEVRISAVCLL